MAKSRPLMVEPKSWYQSKTIWANVIFVLIVALTAIAQWLGVEPSEDLQSYGGTIATVTLAVLNVILRFITRAPVE